LGNWRIEDSARDALERGLADALIISGLGTGLPAQVEDVERVRAACPDGKLLLGSGVTVANADKYLRAADGCIVGSSLKKAGRLSNPVDPGRVRSLARAMRA
jgi:predicted TIM-barrel enzyme